MNLRDVLGVCAFQGQSEPLKKLLYEVGIPLYRISAEQFLLQDKQPYGWHPDKPYTWSLGYNWTWLESAITLIHDAGANVVLGLNGTPCWWEENYPIVRNINGCAIPISRWEWRERVKFHAELVSAQFPEVNMFHIGVETNIKGWWQDPETQGEGAAAQYVFNCIDPVVEALKAKGKKVIAGCPTLQGERRTTYLRAFEHFRSIQELAEANVDHMDLHVYRETGEDTVSDIKMLIDDLLVNDEEPMRKLWITECGFNKKFGKLDWLTRMWYWWTGRSYKDAGEAAQLERWIPVLDFLRFDKVAETYIDKLFVFSGFDSDKNPNGNGILTNDGELTDTAEYIQKVI